MKFYAVIMAALVLSACHPNDTKVKTVKQRIDGGEVVLFSEPGSKLPNCKNSPDWNAFLGMPKDERERSVLGKQQSVINPGNRACYRIGSLVALDNKKSALGAVQIRSIGLGRIDKVRQDDVKGRFFSFREEFNGYLAGVKRRMGGNETGYVYIVNFGYVGGSAVDEKAIKDRDAGPDFEETTGDGTTLDKCSADWTDLLISPEFLQPIQEDKIKSYFKLGRMNCLKQGQAAELKDSLGEGSAVLAKIKIKKVKRFKIAYLEAKYFDLNGYDFKGLQTYINDSVKLKPAEYMTVVDFDLVTGAAVPAVVADCPSAIYLTIPLNPGKYSSVVVGRAAARCAKDGDLLKVVTIITAGELIETTVRVASKVDDPAGETTTLLLERLELTREVAP